MKTIMPHNQERKSFDDAKAAVAHLIALYDGSKKFLGERFVEFADGKLKARARAMYPEIEIVVTSHVRGDSRLSFGHVPHPGHFATTVTRPDLFSNYLEKQIKLLLDSHQVPIVIGPSETPIPIHFAMPSETEKFADLNEEQLLHLRDFFDVPDLNITNDEIVNAEGWTYANGALPLTNFTAQRVDYSLARLAHYTATDPKYFQNFVLFTNYQFYVDEFQKFAEAQIADPASGYEAFVMPGNQVLDADGLHGDPAARLPQMPSYHLMREDHSGITLVNIGVGPSNAKTVTDHIAVLRPHCWIMVGHCAGLRNSQRLGDYVLAHAYMREDHVLDADLPPWVPIPALSEIQIALENAVAETTKMRGFELKQVMRTGTVASTDNRNWELSEMTGPVKRLNQARAIALDMESATVAANGFRFRVPYGTLLCVSDKPLHGELKLPGSASEFYRKQISQHLMIGIHALESLREKPIAELHSRKLRSFNETAFL